ncbi:hypothetical protein SpCBS45565_g05541 [Spizellomyces sp. 'palustris']|nr:hypothetical protein SpCBS45565_g05541 [Spizellomyces sp. 'palustris']
MAEKADPAVAPTGGWVYSPLQPPEATLSESMDISPSADILRRRATEDIGTEGGGKLELCDSETCTLRCAWQTRNRNSIICIVHGKKLPPDDVLTRLQSKVVQLTEAVKAKDAQISQLQERIANMEFMAESAVTENELIIAAETSRCATEQLENIGSAIRSVADDTSAVTEELAQGVPLVADGKSAEDVMKKIASSSLEGDRKRESVAEEDLRSEIERLRQKVAELTSEVESLKAAKAAPLPVLANSGRKLEHATKARPSPRTRTSTKSQSSASEGTTKTLEQDVLSSSPEMVEEKPTEDPAVEFKKKIAGMGGINPLMGLNPGLMAGQLKSGRLSRSQSQETGLELGDVDEKELKDWIFKTIGESSPTTPVDLKELLKDGQILCRVMNAVRPDSLKINTGKFAFARLENINNYLKAAEAAGVAKQYNFSATDLQNGDNYTAVLQNIANLRKIITQKK